MLKLYCIVMLGGAIGTGGRLWLSTLLTARYGEIFPLGTLVINVLGSFIIGFFTGLTGPNGAWATSQMARYFVTIGVLGGFTTFSSFSSQTLALISRGDWPRAGLNIILSVALCLLLCWMGNSVAMLINRG
ncbi:MAG: fluoride efflux transporter CrcB [Verrucomicrobiota bacterium]